MAFLISLFGGGVPTTSKVEQDEAALIKDHNDFQEYTGSDELKRYEELDAQVNSNEFAEKKKEIMGRNFKNTEEYKKEQEYLAQKKSKSIKDYYKIKGSSNLEEFKQTSGSEDLSKYEELTKYIESPEFSQEKQNAGKEFKETEAFKKEQEYLPLKKSSRLKKYYKFKDSPKYQNFVKLDGSEEISRYEELETFVSSEEFKKVKDYMSLSAKKKYEESAESKTEEEYITLKKSEKIIWYFKLKDKNEFNKITDWELSFEDDFDAASLDSKVYTDGKNIEVGDSVVKIVTKKETSSGKLWNPMIGFQKTEFDYTSGLISTGKSFRQKYGKFKAKVKLNNVPIRQAGWMLAETILPHLDLFKYDKNKINMGSFWGNMAEKGGLKSKLRKKGGSKYTSDFYIYTIEWSEDKISWSINDKEMLTQTDNIPQEPMYLVFSSGVTGSVPDHQLPSSLEIDYVRVYRRKS